MNWVKLSFFWVTLFSLALLSCSSSLPSENEEPPGEEPPPGKYEPKPTITQNLVVVTLDGVRWQEVFKGADSVLIHNRGYIAGNFDQIKEKYWVDNEKQRRKALMPFFWNEFVNEGKLYGNREFGNFVNVTNPALKSTPGYSEIWTGYADPSITTNNAPNNPNTNVLEFLNQQSGLEGDKIVVYAAAKDFTKILNVNRSNLSVSAGHKDMTVYNKIMRSLKNDHPRVAYMSLNDTDHWAHEYQYDTYLNLIHKADSLIKNIWDYLQQDEFYKNKTTLMITTDHGRGVGSEWHTHGSGGVAHAGETWLAVVGPDTQPSGEQKGESQIKATEFAKTMAGLLEFNFNPEDHPTGEPIESIIDK